MDLLEQFFRDNMAYVFFVYGSAFIFMGVFILAQPKVYGQLRLVNNIWLLAAFALLHGVNEWLDMAGIIYPSNINIKMASFIFLAASFCFLFEFGRRSVMSRYLRWWLMPAVMAAILALSYNSEECLRTGQILSRYFIALPGAFLTAAALIRYRKDTVFIESSRLDKYGKGLLTAAIAFMAYGILAGFIVPQAGLFPSNVVNADRFFILVHIPVQGFRAIAAVIIALSIAGIIRIVSISLNVKDNADEKDGRPGAHKQEVILGYVTYYSFTVFLVITAIILSILTAVWTKDKEIRELYKHAIEHLNVYNSYMLDKIHNYNTIPRLLAQQPYTIENIKHPDKSNVMNEYLLKFNETIGASVSYVINKEGITTAASNYRTTKSFVGKDFGFRNYFKNAVKGTPYLDIAIGVVSKTPGLYTSYPIRDGEEIIGVAVIKYEIEIFASHGEDKQFLVFAVDNKDVIFHSSDARYKYHTMYKLPEEQIKQLRDSKHYADEPLLPLPIIKNLENNGIRIITIRHTEQSNNTHKDVEYLAAGTYYKDTVWNLHVLADMSGIKISIIKNVISILILMAALLAIGIFIIYRAKSRIKLMASYNDILKQKETVDNHVKEQEIISAILKSSLSNDSLEVQLKRILDIILLHTWRPFQVKGCIFLYDEKQKMLKIAAHQNYSEDQLSICSQVPFGKCLCGAAAATQKVVFSPDSNINSHTQYKNIIAHGEYCVPIISHDKRLLGVININVNVGYERDKEDEHFLLTIAQIVAIVIMRKREMQLLELDRATGLTTLAAGISHEINNPLSFIKSAISTFKKSIAIVEHFIRQTNNLPMPEAFAGSYRDLFEQFDIDNSLSRLHKKIEISNRGIDRIIEVVNGLKSFSRLNAAEVEEVDINKSIDETLSIRIDEKCKVNIVKEYAELPGYLCEPMSINQCFYHIIDNALYAANHIGTIRIATSHIPDEQGGKIKVVIEDDGAGMSDFVKKHAFTPFFTTKEVGAGKGLGLSIVDGIIKRHGGTINIESTEGIGTTVTISLPVINNEMFL
ncbi:MAG: GAF domain-containing protein [Nitrospirae bacterium]|nr:GAF domain-containing protein [Nitrospirota bacterium]